MAKDSKVVNSYLGSSFNRTPTEKAKRLAENAGNAFSGLSSSISSLSQPTNFNSVPITPVNPQYKEQTNTMPFNPKGLGINQQPQSSSIFQKFIEFLKQHPEFGNVNEPLGSSFLQQ